MNKYNPCNPIWAYGIWVTVEKIVAEIKAHYVKRTKNLEFAFVGGKNLNPYRLPTYLTIKMKPIRLKLKSEVVF